MKRASGLLELIYVNGCSPISVETHSEYRYFLTFTDDLNKYGDIYLMNRKSETFERFKQFQSEDHRERILSIYDITVEVNI